MTLTLANSVRAAMCDVLVDSLDAGAAAGYIEIRSGTRPANPDTAETGTLLATITCEDPAFGAANTTTGAATISHPAPVTGVADGTASWFRAYDSDDAPKFDGSVTATGGGGDLTLATVSITTGLSVDVTGGTITVPAS
jgi:hypothetical protein